MRGRPESRLRSYQYDAAGYTKKFVFHFVIREERQAFFLFSTGQCHDNFFYSKIITLLHQHKE